MEKSDFVSIKYVLGTEAGLELWRGGKSGEEWRLGVKDREIISAFKKDKFNCG